MRTQYLVPAALAFLVGLGLWQVQRERLLLDYELVESALFPRGESVGKYFLVRIRNHGNRQLEGVTFRTSFQLDVIESSSVSDDELVPQLQTTGTDVRGVIPLLNPNEILTLTITTRSSDAIPAPDVVVRAPGVTGVPRVDGLSASSLFWQFYVLVLSAIGGLLYYFQRKLKESELEVEKRLTNLRRASGSLKDSVEAFGHLQRRPTEEQPQREQIVFAVFNRAGLGHEFLDMVRYGKDAEYWSTGVALLHDFLVADAGRDRYLGAMRDLVAAPLMTSASRGFILYLLAKMEQYGGDSDAAVTLLRQCREDTPAMYEHLMAQDLAFDLEAIRRKLVDSDQ